MHLYIITGTSTGLGKAMAALCLKNGNSVIGIGRHSTIEHKNYRHIIVDLSDHKTLLNFNFPSLEKPFKRIVLINNAGMLQPVKYCGRAENLQIIQAYTLNLIAPAILSNLFINTFEALDIEKYIVNISSGAANRPVDGWSIYCSSKAGLDMFSRAVAMEREKEKSRLKVVSIAPGIVDTNMQSAIREVNKNDFSRVDDFIEYKEQNQLQTPEVAAEKIISAINRLNTIQDVVFTVKN